MTSHINASSPSGKNRRIELLGTDLIFGGINNVFIYPFLDIDRLKTALSCTLSSWPILTGRVFVDNDQYFIQFTDNSIPFTYVENDQLEQWPTLPVVVDDPTIFEPFIDAVKYEPETEALLRLKVTRLVQSGEYVFGTSFWHMVGDADSNIHFLNDLSQAYQHLEPLLPRPTFERHVLDPEDPQFSALPVIKLFRNAGKRETVLARLGQEQKETEPIHLSFSSAQLTQLRTLAGGHHHQEITMHDALCAYILLTLNKHFFLREDEYIRRVYMTINYRSELDSLATNSYVANALMQPLSPDFDNPLSLSSIAQTIRQSIQSAREESFRRKWVSSANALMTKFIKDESVNFVWDTDEVILNSNYKYDWSNQANFGMVDQCRFHTAGLYKFYLRIFQTNPVKGEDGNWTKDSRGAEVAFRIPKGEGKEKFIEAWKKDVETNFFSVQ